MPMTDLARTLQHALDESSPPSVCVAFSGGPDSTALLHALAQLPAARARGLRALHVDHGLHADSASWAEHCRAFCTAHDIPLQIVRVRVDDARGEGVEAAARRARYAAFADHLDTGEWLALAHHRDDQIETVLLKLLRGAGPEGLGGMRALRPLARGFLWRPLLETPRSSLGGYLAARDLPCINDPANAETRHARNVVRHEILPRMAGHWPHAGASILHGARLNRAAADYIAGAAQSALAVLLDADNRLDATGWLALHDALRAPVLDQWLRGRALPSPSDAQRQELERQAATATQDATPCIAWPGAEVRIWHGQLHAMPPLQTLPADWQAAWDGAPLRLPADCGTLQIASDRGETQTTPSPRLDPSLTVRLRRGGERIKPAGDSHTRELRDLFQQAHMQPWLRMRCPLIYADDELIAVGDRWVSERGLAMLPVGAKPRWLHHAGQAS